MAWEHPTGTVPEKVVLVANGYSREEFVQSNCIHDDIWDEHEIWAINTGIKWVPRADLIFIMDDMDLYGSTFPSYGQFMADEKRPIITSAKYEKYPSAIAYPLREVMTSYERTVKPYFHDGSLPYILAYAGFIGVKQIELFGVDYVGREGSGKTEQGRPCAEYWAGVLGARGVMVSVCGTSTFMNQKDSGTKRIYGYLKPPPIYNTLGQVVGFNNQLTRKALPSEVARRFAAKSDDPGRGERERPPCAVVPGTRP